MGAETTETISGGRDELEERLGRKVVQQAAVAELGRLALTRVALPQLFEHAVAMTHDALDTDLAAILQLDSEAGMLTCRANVGWRDEWIRPVPLDGGSMLAHTFLQQEPTVVDDLAADTRFPGSRYLLEQGIVSALAVPMRGDARAVGVLVAHCRRARRFTPDEVLFLRGMGNVLAAAIENARAHEAEHAARERAERLQRVTARLADALTVDAVTDVLLTEGLEAMGAPSGLVAVVEGDLVRVLAERGYAADTFAEWSTFAVDDQLPVSEAVRTQEPVFVVGRADRDARFPLLAGLPDTPSHALVALPLVASGEAFGAVVLSFDRERSFSEDERQFLQALAKQCAQALDRARLYEERERRAEAARALEFVADGVVLVDRAGVVRLWNEAAARISGIAESHAVGTPLVDLVGPVKAPPGRPVTVPVDVRGRELWLSVSAVPFSEGVVYAFRDTTDEYLLDQMKSDFIATVSHELRTPLAAVYGAATTLRQRRSLPEDDRERFLEMIEQQAERLSGIVNEILVASRLESGELPLDLRPVDAVEVAENVVAVVGRGMPDGFELTVSAAPDVPRVVADPDRLGQVLGNLLENAVKYAGESRSAEIAIEAVDGRVLLAVRDAGIGIPPAATERIFEKFFRVDPGMRHGVSGTGLGLYIVRELVRRMGGSIRVESAVGKGSTFVVELPAATSAA